VSKVTNISPNNNAVNMNLKEIKIMFHLVLEDMPELNTKAEIAEAINNVIYENPDLFPELTEDNIVDVREYNQ
jgi:hypothetical protein